MKKEKIKIPLMVLMIVGVTCFPYLQEGLCGYIPDLLYHLLRIEGVKESIILGEFPPRIYSNFFNGFGYGSPMFYPDIFLVFPAVLRIFSVDPISAYKIFAVAVCTFSTLTTYYSLKYITKDSNGSIIGTFLIMLSQFWLADLHHRVGISEYIAFAFIPVLIAGIYDFFMYDGKRTWLMGVAFTGLLLSHTIMTFIGVLLTIIIFIRMLFKKKEENYLFDKNRMKNLIITALCTVLITAYYTFPMLEQMIFFGNELSYTEPWAHIGKYTQPFSSFFRIKGYFSTIAYVGIGIPVLGLMALCCFLKKPKSKWVWTFFCGGCALFLASTSFVPWGMLENSILNMIQFTYRLWPYAIVFVVIGIVMILSENSSRYSEKQKCLFFIAIIGCTVLVGLFQNRMIAASSIESREFNAQYLEEYNNYVGAGEWLPLGVAEEITDLEAETLVVPDQGDRKDLTTSGKYKIFYNDKEAESYQVPLIYYKGYEAWLYEENGTKTQLEIQMADNAQVLVINQKDKQGNVYVHYAGTIIQKVSNVVSLLSIIFVIGCWILNRKREWKRKR